MIPSLRNLKFFLDMVRAYIQGTACHDDHKNGPEMGNEASLYWVFIHPYNPTSFLSSLFFFLSCLAVFVITLSPEEEVLHHYFSS